MTATTQQERVLVGWSGDGHAKYVVDDAADGSGGAVTGGQGSGKSRLSAWGWLLTTECLMLRAGVLAGDPAATSEAEALMWARLAHRAGVELSALLASVPEPRSLAALVEAAVLLATADAADTTVFAVSASLSSAGQGWLTGRVDDLPPSITRSPLARL